LITLTFLLNSFCNSINSITLRLPKFLILGANFIISNSIINFTSNTSNIFGVNNNNYQLSILNSVLYGNNSLGGSMIDLNDQANITFINTIFNNFDKIMFDGCDNYDSCKINIDNVTFQNINGNLFLYSLYNGFYINNLNFYGNSEPNTRCIYIKNTNNSLIYNSNLYNCNKEGISIYGDNIITNTTFINNTITTISYTPPTDGIYNWYVTCRALNYTEFNTTNRNYILIEKETEYVKICEERLKQLTNK
jgi:hypothetical protein